MEFHHLLSNKLDKFICYIFSYFQSIIFFICKVSWKGSLLFFSIFSIFHECKNYCPKYCLIKDKNRCTNILRQNCSHFVQFSKLLLFIFFLIWQNFGQFFVPFLIEQKFKTFSLIRILEVFVGKNFFFFQEQIFILILLYFFFLFLPSIYKKLLFCILHPFYKYWITSN